MTKSQTRPTIAIIGGGFSGAAVAFHLLRQSPAGSAQVVVIEPRSDLGRGLAYSTPDPAHRLNVPVRRMTLISDQPDHFHDWLARPTTPRPDPAAMTATGEVYVQRRIFGDYMRAQVQPLLESGALRHIHATVLEVTPQDGRYVLYLADATELTADIVVFAVTHPAPSVPAPLRDLPETVLIADPSAPQALDAIRHDDRILIVGTGLTSADITASLLQNGHTGPITAISRHGWRSRDHAPVQAETATDFTRTPSRTALGLLRRIRASIRQDAAAGLTWHATLDRVRVQAGAIWTALTPPEQRRLLRHLRSLWDVHRFRIAPQVSTALNMALAHGQLSLAAASLVSATPTADGIVVTTRLRHPRSTMSETFDRIIITTGPAHGSVIRDNPALASAHAAGLLEADGLGLGIATDSQGRALSPDGIAQPRLFIAGPLARATFGELMGVPEVTRYAEFIAAGVAQAPTAPR